MGSNVRQQQDNFFSAKVCQYYPDILTPKIRSDFLSLSLFWFLHGLIKPTRARHPQVCMILLNAFSFWLAVFHFWLAVGK